LAAPKDLNYNATEEKIAQEMMNSNRSLIPSLSSIQKNFAIPMKAKNNPSLLKSDGNYGSYAPMILRRNGGSCDCYGYDARRYTAVFPCSVER